MITGLTITNTIATNLGDKANVYVQPKSLEWLYNDETSRYFEVMFQMWENKAAKEAGNAQLTAIFSGGVQISVRIGISIGIAVEMTESLCVQALKTSLENTYGFTITEETI